MSKGHGLREESVSLFYHLRPPPIAITTASYSPPYLPAIFSQSSRNLFAISTASFRNRVRMSSRVPQLVLKSTTAGTRPHTLLHRLTKQGVWGDTPCCIVPCTLRHCPLHPAASSPGVPSSPPTFIKCGGSFCCGDATATSPRPTSPPLHAKQNFKNLANLANKVNLCKKNYGFLTKLARLARFLKFCFAKSCRRLLGRLSGKAERAMFSEKNK